MLQSAQSIEELHGEGVLHNDIKADNFLARLRLDDEGESSGVEVKVRVCTCGTSVCGGGGCRLGLTGQALSAAGLP